MDDNAIIDLYWAREERALTETHKKYGRLCWSIAQNILRNKEDTEECVNDTYLHAWNALPPQRPTLFSAFLGRITRNLSLDRYKQNHAGKRGGGNMALALAELGDCVPSADSVEKTVAAAELSDMIDKFLRTIPEKDCCIFLRRYWYVDSIPDIAQRYQMPQGSVKSNLHRTRNKLRAYLEQEGIAV